VPWPVVGCSADAPALRQELRALESQNARPRDPAVEAMRPMLGKWVVDLDATLAENAALPPDALEFARRDLTDYPFELTITDRDYVSRSWVKTNADHYSVVSVDGDTVTIALSAADGVNRRPGRTTRLRVRGGNLLIDTGGPFTCVLSRPPRA
jgi:hypothetical protein